MIYGSQIAAAGMLKQKHGATYCMGTTKRALTYFMDGLANELVGTAFTRHLSPGVLFERSGCADAVK